jgi:hypothetical protein
MTYDELRAEMAKIPDARGGRQLTGDGMREGLAVDVGGGDWHGFEYLVPIDDALAAAARARFHASVVKALRIQRAKKGADFSPALARYLDARGEA